ncbi:MAG: hypothetical protein INR62_04730 [Rhodospirillales bacterium]|nr:hypothetical protein [Acetobacter sp.]
MLSERIGASENKAGAFEKVAECLYRYSTNGVYYACFESWGKEIRRSLGTTDKATARRKLGDLQRDLARVDLAAGRCSLAEMCGRYLATVQNQRPKTIERKTAIARRIKADFPDGADVALGKIVPSKVSAWLASYDFGSASYNLYLEFIRAVFNLAVEDRLVPESPGAPQGQAAIQADSTDAELRGLSGHRGRHPRAALQHRLQRQR